MPVSESRLLSPIDPARFLSISLFKQPLQSIIPITGSVLFDVGRSVLNMSTAPLDVFNLYDIEPPHGGAHPHKFVLYEPESAPGTTAMVTNLRDGWSTLVGSIARRTNTLAVQITSTGDAAKYPKQLFRVWDIGVERRVILLMRDTGRWLFEQRGAPMPFEFVEQYDLKPKRVRLNRATLFQYATSMGWDLTDMGFWRSSDGMAHYEQPERRSSD
jgi:hypothetical protein